MAMMIDGRDGRDGKDGGDGGYGGDSGMGFAMRSRYDH